LKSDFEKSLIVLGSSGHAKVLIEALLVGERKIIGITDPAAEKGTIIMGVPVLGTDMEIEQFASGEVELVNGLGALPYRKARWTLAKRFRDKGYAFAQVIHPSAVIAGDVEFAEGVQIMAGVVIQPGVKIGRDSIINTRSSIDHDCEIGNNCHLAPGVTLSGGVHVGENAHIGTGTVVTHAVSVGSDTIIGAGSVIYRDVPERVKIIQRREEI
jgi:UDP-perosamine 4-acetyltransferase